METGTEGFQAVVVTRQGECGGVVDSFLGGGTDKGGLLGLQGEDGHRLSWWEDDLKNLTLGTDPNAPIAYDLGLEHHHPIISTLEEPGCQFEREININKY